MVSGERDGGSRSCPGSVVGDRDPARVGRAVGYGASGEGGTVDAGVRGDLASGAGAGGGASSGAWRDRVGPAVRERMPLWLQSRCGLERRSVAALTVLLVVAAVFAVQHFWAGRTQSVRAPEVVRAAAPFGEPAGQAKEQESAPDASAGSPGPFGAAGTAIVVDVSGKVRSPGLQRLPSGSRVEDALRAAGGVRPGTNTEGLNRARLLMDGEQIVVGAPVFAGDPARARSAPVGPSAVRHPPLPFHSTPPPWSNSTASRASAPSWPSTSSTTAPRTAASARSTNFARSMESGTAGSPICGIWCGHERTEEGCGLRRCRCRCRCWCRCGCGCGVGVGVWEWR